MIKALDTALDIARDMKLPVFPCDEKPDEKGKISKRPYVKGGFKAATLDEQQISKWWTRWPDALIGVPTGEITGLFVVDIDQSDTKNGELSFEALGLGDPVTCQTLTQSGGRHLIFKYPNGYDLNCDATGKLAAHVDIRANGGYVIWAGSVTRFGKYQYRPSFSPKEVGFQEMPEELLEKLIIQSKDAPRSIFQDQSIIVGQRNDTLFMEGVNLVHNGVSDEKVSAYIEARATDCIEKLDPKEIEKIKDNATSYRSNSLIPFTDLGNGERLVRDWAGEIIFCKDQKAWYAWSGTHWEMDEAKVRQFAKRTTRDMPAEPSISNEIMQKRIAWQKASEAIARQTAMLEAASFDPLINRTSSIFANDLDLFNLNNGTFDLRSQTLRDHNRSDYITKLANASLRPEAKCPRWLSFIQEITDDDERLAHFIQKFCGYLLSGRRNEQIILFLVGSGANGKSVFLSLLKHVLGTYAGVISSKALIDRSTSSIPSDIAALANKRFVMLSEFPEHVPLNTATVKSITGGDEITARHLYKEWFAFKPQFQIACAVNDLPRLDWVDDAYFRRVRIVPFRRVFNQANMDKSLEVKLCEEADGIINWMVKGYHSYTREGLEPTPKMTSLLSEYRFNEDPVNQFVKTSLIECEQNTFVPMFELMRAFRDFCSCQGFDFPTERVTKKRLRDLLGPSVQQRHGPNQERHRGYRGYTIQHPKEDNNPW